MHSTLYALLVVTTGGKNPWDSNQSSSLQIVEAVFAHAFSAHIHVLLINGGSVQTYKRPGIWPDTSFVSSAYTSLVERFHCQVGSEGWYGVHPPYKNIHLKSMG